MLSVEQLCSETGLELLAGHQAATTPVRWVHSTELLDPTPWLSGGELLLTTGLQLTSPTTQRAFIRRLASHGIAGLGLGIGFTHATMPAAMLKAAETNAFPLFEVPYELPFIALTERAFSHIGREQYEALRRSITIQERLERLVLEELGLDEVVRAVAEAIGGGVWVLTPRGETMAERWSERPIADSAAEAICSAIRAQTAAGEQSPSAFEPSLDDPHRTGLALPVASRGRPSPQAWLIGVPDEGMFGDFERLILQQTVTVVALELMRQRVGRETERRFAGDVLAEALTGRLPPEEIEQRLRPFGIEARLAVLTFAVEDPGAAEPLLDRAIARVGGRGLVATRGRLVCAVLDAEDVDPIEVAAQIRAELADELGTVRAAVSRPAAAPGLRRAFHEARCALEAARLDAALSDQVATHRNLGAYALLLSLQDEDALRTYSDGVLGAVTASNNGYGDELLRSVEAFIEHNGQWESAARELYCHRHTLRYRIRRVEELTGRNLSNARDRIEVWLALRAKELV